jgi:hypothetical protein
MSAIARVIRIVWVAGAVACLVLVEIIARDPEAYQSASALLVFAMLILTFPAGYIALEITYWYSSILVVDRFIGPLDFLIVWLIFSVIGYLQWFKLVPWVAQRIFQRRAPGSA